MYELADKNVFITGLPVAIQSKNGSVFFLWFQLEIGILAQGLPNKDSHIDWIESSYGNV